MMFRTEDILDQAIAGHPLHLDEGVYLYDHAGDGELMETAHAIRMRMHPEPEVGWIIDRNVNITNVCVSFCKFCNFCRRSSDEDAYVTTIDQYREKIGYLYHLGGRQLLLQGGMHPGLGLDFYTGLFRRLKEEFPDLRLHALGPPEVVHLSKLEGTDFETILTALIRSGLDSLPGAGAEILVDRVRKLVSRGKCSTGEWLEVMRIAHRLKLPTSATMMFGHLETHGERMEHLIRIRELQAEKPAGSVGFLNFVPWPFMDQGTVLREQYGVRNRVDARMYIRTLAMSRILLNNIPHIQASWLTVGKVTGQIGLHAGANDFGSVMIEENVVSSAGVSNRFDIPGIQEAIREAGFIPRQRNQLFEYLD